MNTSIEKLQIQERAKLYRDMSADKHHSRLSRISTCVPIGKVLHFRHSEHRMPTKHQDHSRKRATSADESIYSVKELINIRSYRNSRQSLNSDSDVTCDVIFTEKAENTNRIHSGVGFKKGSSARRRSVFVVGNPSSSEVKPKQRSKSFSTEPVAKQSTARLWRKASLTLPILNFNKKLMNKRQYSIQRFFQKALLAKFRMAAKLAIFCARNFKQHCLRINESQDELAPFIKRLHFREDDTSDLLIDLSQFKANRQLRIPDEAKRILSKELESRTDQEVYSVTVALRNIKSYAEYPNRMQKKIAEVGLYEKYESKRVIVRQNHPATAFYFILSGAVVVMVMDEETKFARPVAHLYKGHTFGELAIINGTKRNSTVIAKETCEFLSISVQDYHKIFMAGGVKNISDPDQEIFLKSLKCLANWPIHILPQNPNKCQFLFFKNANVIIRDSNISEWIIIVKSGSVQVLKKLKKVEAFAWKKKKQEQIILTDRRDLSIKQTDFRRILPQLRIPLNPDMEEEEVDIQTNGRPLPFRHPIDNFDTESTTSSQPMVSRIPNLWPFNVDLSQMESGRYLEDEHRLGKLRKNQIAEVTTGKKSGLRIVARSLSEGLGVKTGRDRSASMINEEEAELGGFQAHIRTIQEDLDPSAARQKVTDTDETVDLNPEFVLVHTLTKGQVFGLSDVIIGEQPSFSVVSKGADCILINKNFYLEHASDRLINEMRQELCPYPTEEQLQQGLQENVDWHAYRKTMLLKSLSTVGVRRQLRSTINGTKVQEAY